MLLRTLTLIAVACPICLGQTDGERFLLNKITELEARLAALEKRLAIQPAPVQPASPPPTAVRAETVPEPPRWWQDTTASLYFDGYYAWNTNRPVGRVNLLRAYDVTANNLGINQTGVVVERAPKAASPWGYRLDLMYGQATETLQGGAQNEPRPQVYRNLFQAYGTYVLPVRRGVTIDFGKWASALGTEGNYTKDQINYSRSYFFNLLPFYHMGVRTTLPVNDRLSVSYWLVNGANQTEDLNGFKSQLGQAIIRPAKNLTWTLNYYSGQEQRDLVPSLNPGLPLLPTQPGLSTTGLRPLLRGRLHIIDTYATWNVNSRLLLGGELDYVVNRVEKTGPGQVVTGGAGYLRYQLTGKAYFGQRYTRLNDRAGLFSGASQSLNDLTSTFGYRPADGFEARLEFRRDFSNAPFFLRRTAGDLARQQSTYTLGLLWWFGGKTGGW
jgi:hypothetical protein